jgi:hypothetical protein
VSGKALEDEKSAVEYTNGLGGGGGYFQFETTEGMYGFAGGIDVKHAIWYFLQEQCVNHATGYNEIGLDPIISFWNLIM